ncbi:hypothetical protein BLNAU_23648 [Blattamonas nauphoetae]|uniref:Uncharacterized protein n=1 Tax=Blattamonas nauphoetae TaxID=2049346 RepID=A0ABQ9WPM5_9EUKA|nr:hypothetical protein BLNAU_23648 [Blattamonas nauphoetae]
MTVHRRDPLFPRGMPSTSFTPRLWGGGGAAKKKTRQLLSSPRRAGSSLSLALNFCLRTRSLLSSLLTIPSSFLSSTLSSTAHAVHKTVNLLKVATFATSPSSHTLPSPTLSRAHRTPSQSFFSDPHTTFGAIGPDQPQPQKRKPENEKPHTAQQTILGRHLSSQSATDANMSPSTSRISVGMQWMCDSPFKPALSVPFNEDELGLDDSDDDKTTPSLYGSWKESDTMLSATTSPRHSSLAKSPNPTLLSANARPFVPSYSSSSFYYHPPQSVTPTFFPQPSPPPDTPFRKISTRDLQYLMQHEQNKIDERRRWKEWRGEIDAKYGIWASQRESISETRMPSVPVDRGQQQESDSSSTTRGRKKPMLNRREKREQDEWMRWGGMDYNERHGGFG